MHISSNATSSCQPVVITHCLIIKSNMKWNVYVHGNQLCPKTCQSLRIPDELDLPLLHTLLDKIDHLNVCCGQPDMHFVSMVKAKKGEILTSCRWKGFCNG